MLLLAVTVWDQNEIVTTRHAIYYCFPTFSISWQLNDTLLSAERILTKCF